MDGVRNEWGEGERLLIRLAQGRVEDDVLISLFAVYQAAELISHQADGNLILDVTQQRKF